jgi:hypothetical protein
MGGRSAGAPRLLSAALALALLPVGATAAAVIDAPGDPAAPGLQVLPLHATSAAASAEQDSRLELSPTPTRPFTTLGVTWSHSREVQVTEVLVRTRSARTGQWTGWAELPVEPADSSPSAGRDGTTAMYVGGSDGVEARVTARGGREPVDLRVDLVDPGPAPAGASLRSAAVTGLGGARVIPREQWGADPQAQCDQTAERAGQVVLVSRSLATSDYTRPEAAAVVRGLQAFDMLSRGWCDLGAAYVVDRFGRSFAGRTAPAGTPVAGQGNPGFDASAVGVAVLAADPAAAPTTAQVAGMVPLVAGLLAPAHADPAGSTVVVAGPGSALHAPGEQVRSDVISDRRSAVGGGALDGPTDRALAQLRRRVANAMPGALVAPAASTSSLRLGVDERLTVQARVLGPQEWSLVVRDPEGAVVRLVEGSARTELEASWDLRDDEGALVAPGRYQVTLTGRAAGRNGRPWTTEVELMGPGRPAEEPGPPESGAIWAPAPGTAWQWQLQGDLDLTVDVPVYDLDGFTTSRETVAALRSAGRHSICYLSVGAWEDWRPDAGRFPEEVLGADNGWPGERWLDIRRIDVLAPVLRERIAMCRAKGFEAVEPDNVDGYVNDSGFPLTPGDQLRFNRWLADEVHRQGMSVGLKNDLDQVQELVHDFDFAVNEQCFEFSECEQLLPFVRAGKAVLHVEYDVPAERFCGQVPAGFSSMQKRLDLDAWRRAC